MIAAAFAALAAFVMVPQPPTRRLRAVIAAPATGRRLDPATLATLAVGSATVAVLGWPTGVLTAVPAALVARRLVGGLESAPARRAREEQVAAVPHAVDLMVAALSAGRPPAVAFALAAAATDGRLGERIGRVAALLAAAGDPQRVWTELSGDEVLGAVARALRRADACGVSAVGVLGHVADDLRRGRIASLRSRAAGVGPATSAPLGICFLPAFFLAGIVPTVIGLAGTVRW